MQGLNITGEVRIFAKENGGKIYYNAGLSTKDVNNNWLKAFMPVTFRKGIEIPDGTDIEITKGFISFYMKNNGIKDDPVYKAIITEFNIKS